MTRKVYFKAQNVFSSPIQSGIKDRIILNREGEGMKVENLRREIDGSSVLIMQQTFQLIFLFLDLSLSLTTRNLANTETLL